MAAINSLRTTKDQVELILRRVPESRDEPVKLYIILLNQFSRIDPNEITAMKLFELIHNGMVPSMPSVLRCSQKLQQDNEELRGKNYGKRQEMGEQVRRNINGL
jgi:hypothetical protein